MANKTGNIEPEQQAEIEDVIKRFHRTGDLSNFVHTMEEILLGGKEE